ncbi:MAG: T9SS type A sorting domain-containing protein [Ignavibacteriaceae bacterium]|nr:T9SS type A sorting domain-containing protein [Ignavibacteriaceae bacterium]
MRALKIFLLVFIPVVTVSAQWYQQNSGTTTYLYSVFFIDETTGWACGDSGKIIKTTNGGLDWLEQNSNTTVWIKGIQFVDANNGWAFGGNQILSSTNGGSSWTAHNFLSSTYLSALQFVNVNMGWVISHNVSSADTSCIYRTTDGGISWTLQTQTPNEYFETIYFLNENYGWVPFFLGVLKTTNGGISWTQNIANLQGSPMCIRFADHQTGWISSNTLGSYDISKSIDGGLNWFSQISGPGEFIQSISCSNANTVYAAGIQPFVDDGFIWKTTDGGASWFEQYREDGELYSIFFVNDTMGWSVGRSGKILVTENGGVTSVEEKNEMNPKYFTLSQNYPNPFNPSTKIKFTISSVETTRRVVFTTLKVYDVLGNEVVTLVNEELAAGEYEVEFDGSKLTSGIYFYKLSVMQSARRDLVLKDGQSGKFSETKKMIYLT